MMGEFGATLVSAACQDRERDVWTGWRHSTACAEAAPVLAGLGRQPC